jgi:hypothetical protein
MPAALNRETLDDAQARSIGLDWLYRGDRSRLPHHLAVAIARIEAVELETY